MITVKIEPNAFQTASSVPSLNPALPVAYQSNHGCRDTLWRLLPKHHCLILGQAVLKQESLVHQALKKVLFLEPYTAFQKAFQ